MWAKAMPSRFTACIAIINATKSIPKKELCLGIMTFAMK